MDRSANGIDPHSVFSLSSQMSRLVIPTLETIEFRLVTINDEAVGRFAETLRSRTPRRSMYTEFDLHPTPNDKLCANWVFLIDCLNFSFWHKETSNPYRVEFNGKEEFGYASLCAIIKRALCEGYPMTEASFWSELDEPTWRHIARGVTCEIPLIMERLAILNSTGKTLVEVFGGDFANVIRQADHDIYRLIDLVLQHFPYFRDQTPDGRHKFMKRVQILVADLWSCYDGTGLGQFDNIEEITMFADYRVPQALLELGILEYSPELMATLASDKCINDENENVVMYGREEIEIRASSILAVDRVKQRLGRDSPWNVILIDFYLWNYSKTIDRSRFPFHRLRTLFY